MPSLRRSLIVYFLVLVGLALGGLGLLIDRFAASALAARLHAETRRIDAEADAAREKAVDKFDDQLLADAKALAKEYRNRMWGVTADPRRLADRFNLAMQLMPLGDSGAVWPTAAAVVFTQSGGPQAFTRWTMFGHHYNGLLRDKYESIRSEFQLSADHPDFYQLHVPPTRDAKERQVLCSPKQPFELPARFDGLSADTDHHFDDVSVAGVGTLRRVVYRSSFTLPNVPGRPAGGAPSPSPRPDRPRGPDPGPLPNPGPPPLFVQTAFPKAALDPVLADLADKRDTQLATSTAESEDALHRLRLRIAGIGGVTFLAVVVGGWLLTGIGLAPLRKLSDAVSHVNEKDFRLPIEKGELTTELVPIHDRLTQSLDALRRAFEREKAAVADISHELRTPVAGMLATMDVALRKPRTADQYKETLTECRAIAKQLGGLVERVMTLAYLDAGHAHAPPIPVDIGELAGGCAAVIRPLATAHGLTLKTDLPPEVEFTTDPDRLREVLMNLLHNAIEYNRPGGIITLRAERDAAGLTVEVADTGIGMSDDVKAKIFDRFFRADPSRTATGAHAGLGLAIVKEAVGRMGGSIAVDSTPAAGSSFRVRLPG